LNIVVNVGAKQVEPVRQTIAYTVKMEMVHIVGNAGHIKKKRMDEMKLNEIEKWAGNIEDKREADYVEYLITRIRELGEDVKKYFDSCCLREESLFTEVERRERAEARIRELEEQLRLAIEHDLQPYPTAYAYEKVCETLHEKEVRIKELEEGIERHKKCRFRITSVDFGTSRCYSERLRSMADEELYKLIEKEKP